MVANLRAQYTIYQCTNLPTSSKWSNLRRRVYVDVLTEVVKHDVQAAVLLARKRDLDRRYFAGKDYLAYNYLRSSYRRQKSGDGVLKKRRHARHPTSGLRRT